MQRSQRIQRALHCAFATSLLASWLTATFPAGAQAPPVKKSKAAKKASSSKAPAPPAAPVVRPPMTKDQVQTFWKNKAEDLFLNELKLRKLAFEPEESWLMGLPAATGVQAAEVPSMTAAIRELVPPAPDVDAVSQLAPDLLAKLKDAAQKRSETLMEPLVHPDLLLDKARVYDLFDTANYRTHQLGKFSPQDNRRVGVQFFQLTTSQVERLHYVLFSNSRGKVVVRDVVTGPAVADLFLRDEQKLALSKLDLVFRALNDGDEAGLKLLCTPGLYDSMKRLAGDTKAGAARITQGLQISQIQTKASVPLDSKSIRVVVRVSYATRRGRKIEYDIDFERVDNDLKVVRLRDTQNAVIAWDPDIDNWLNRRFGLPDGPQVTNVAQSGIILPLPMVREFFMRALEDRNAVKIQEYADEFLDSEPNSGVGYGMRAAANHILAKYVEAEKDAVFAIDRGGVVYIPVLRHQLWNQQSLWPVVLAISTAGIEYLPPAAQGGAPEKISLDSIEKLKIEAAGRFSKARPFLELEFRQLSANGKREKKNYNFAAVGTICQGATPLPDRTDLVPFAGNTICGSQSNANGTKSGPIPGIPFGNNTVAIPTLVPRTWAQDLNVVLRTVEQAQRLAAAGGTQRSQR